MFFPLVLNAQTIAVSEIAVDGITSSPQTVTKMARLEVVKIEKYTVLDEFDMLERLKGKANLDECYGKNCLIEKGKQLGVDYILSGQVLGTGPKIIVQLKVINVETASIELSGMHEFDDMENELQRMLGIVIQDMHNIPSDEVIKKRLSYKNEEIVSNDVGKLNNTGPRFGLSYFAYGELAEFATRSEANGGLEIYPVISNIGYQFEGEYIGTENFGALAEFIVNVGAMDQGRFIPSISLLNGFRFGKSGYEFAFGPSIGLRRVSQGIYVDGSYFTKKEYTDLQYDAWESNPANFDPNDGTIINPFEYPSNDIFSTQLDRRGDFQLNANWVVAFGRTFKAGSLNIPVNLYYSSNKYGGMLGVNVGFNMTNSKVQLNK